MLPRVRATLSPISVSALQRRARLAEGLIFTSLGVAAIVVAVVVRAYPDYDTYYALVWGHELLQGHLPSFTAFAAPTQHPLFNVLAAVVGLVAGDHADRAMVAACALAHVALTWGVYRLGRWVANWAVGAISAVFVMTSPLFLEFTSRAHVDMPFLAFVVWAGVAAAERPARPGVPMLLPAYLQLPDVRWHLDAGRDAVISRADPAEHARTQLGVALVARGDNADALGAPGLPARANAAPAGFAEVARNATFAAYVRCA
jgi:hypothetical protein